MAANKDFCQSEVMPNVYSPKVLVGNWQNERNVPSFKMTTADPLPSKNIEQFKSTYKIDYRPQPGFKVQSNTEDKLQYLTALPFQGPGPNSSVEDGSASFWISEMKDKFRHPEELRSMHSR